MISRNQSFCGENQRRTVNSKLGKHRLYKRDQKIKKLNNIQIRFSSCCSPRSITYWPTGLLLETKSILCAFFCVIPRSLNFICPGFGTLCLFHLHRQVGTKNDWVQNVGVFIRENVRLENSYFRAYTFPV
jgi:hypothetical protein